MSILPLPPRAPQARRHSTATLLLARTMYGDGDAWNPAEIAAYLTTHGTPVAASTVRFWVKPEIAEARNARRAARRAAAQPSSSTPLLDRMRQLRAAGVTLNSIAAVLRVDEDMRLTGDTVRYYLREGREPRR